MRREPRAGGGDQHQGAATPRVIAARTDEAARPDASGGPHPSGLTLTVEYDTNVAAAAEALLALLPRSPQRDLQEAETLPTARSCAPRDVA